ncbi:DUF4376 domain-containing protein [Xanthobacter sp. VTT E-85241]|uniref:DUF4376 domain-containing protein n=1 Tax=Roseixanthobacter finlandensis TaxID=3119922 RepID=UPI00372932BE
MMYNPRDWYWLGADGRLYSSAAGSVVALDTPAYLAWIAAGNVATRWPRDEAGAQTDAALRDVLAPYGLSLSPTAALLAHAAQRRWEIETGGIEVAGQMIRTDEQSQAKISGACVLLSNDPDVASIDWEAQPGTWVTLDRATMISIGVAVGRHVQRCFSALRQIQGEITAENITTTGAIDAAFAAALAP